MSLKEKFTHFVDHASRARLMVYACVLGLIGLLLMSWSFFDQGWIPVMAAMSVGQGIGTLSFVLFLLIVYIDLRRADFRPSMPPQSPSKQSAPSEASE